MQRHYDVLVVGGGIIGTTAAWRIAQLGLRTAVADCAPSRCPASLVAAGMLAPVTEAAYGEVELLHLNLESARRYPEFLADLSAASGQEISAYPNGTIFAAVDRDQAEGLSRLHDFQTALGLEAAWMDRRECRRLEPGLHPSTLAGIYAATDTAVDPRVLMTALRAALEGAGGHWIHAAVVADVEPGDRPAVNLADGRTFSAGHVILAAGCWTGQIGGVPGWLSKALRPVKGQILRLQPLGSDMSTIGHVIRTEEVYLVPRPGGQVVVGATVEERGYSREVTAGAVYELLRASAETVPATREMQLCETSAGLRPGTPDNAPLIGPCGLDGISTAAGHYRNGVLLAPVTADALVQLVVKGEPPSEMAAFSPLRFAV